MKGSPLHDVIWKFHKPQIHLPQCMKFLSMLLIHFKDFNMLQAKQKDITWEENI